MHRSFQEYINTPYIEKGERERDIGGEPQLPPRYGWKKEGKK